MLSFLARLVLVGLFGLATTNVIRYSIDQYWPLVGLNVALAAYWIVMVIENELRLYKYMNKTGLDASQNVTITYNK